MMNPLPPAQPAAPPPGWSREDQAKLEIGHTEIGPVAMWTLVLVFLTTIVAVPVLQAGHEWLSHRAGRRETPRPQAVEIIRAFPAAAAAWQAADGGRWPRLRRANEALLRGLHEYEEELERASWLRARLLPPGRLLLARAGAGNEQVYLGRDGWLFYRPAIELVAGPGFLDKAWLTRRAQGGSAWQPPPASDPRPAILDFQAQLAARGIRLVLMPTPVKSMIHPEKFSRRPGLGDSVLLNPSHEIFCREMEQAGVLVFDPAAAMMAAKFAGANDRASPAPQFLATDTHWRPEAMDRVAAALAHFLRAPFPPPPAAARSTRTTARVTATGDLVRMLRLPPDQRLFPPETVTLQPVRHATGEQWASDPAADVLLLGDSFANIYSLEEMQWGTGAGLAEQLSFHWGGPLDTILRNDRGAFATRQMLAAELARGRDRLAGKRVVIWQFAARELSVGDWKLIPLPPPPPVAAPADSKNPAGANWMATVSGVVAQASAVPGRGVPYKDHIRALHVTGLATQSGPAPAGDAVVYVWSMRDRELTPEARLRAGDRVTFRVRPWGEVADPLGRINRSELDDPELLLRPAWWGERVRE